MAFSPSVAIRTRSTSDRKSTRLNSSHGYISYAVFCLKKKKNEGCKVVAGENKDEHKHYVHRVGKCVGELSQLHERQGRPGRFTGKQLFFFFNDPAPTEIYTLSLHDALPICRLHHGKGRHVDDGRRRRIRRQHRDRLGRSEEHTSELQSRLHIVCRLLLE